MLPVAAQDSIFDTSRLTALKRASGERSPEAIKAVAQQFEALFMQMILKQMRSAASFGGGGLDGEEVGFYRGMADQQLALNLSRSGGFGLARALERQLGASMMPTTVGPATNTLLIPEAAPANAAAVQPQALPATPAAAGTKGAVAGDANSFVDRIWPHALGAAQALGVPAQFVVAHAALETGWGKGEIRFPDGRPSYNLFNIKAGGAWTGAVVEAHTTEYVNGVAQHSVERFRAYSSYEEAFRDYARLLTSSPRYAGALGQTSADAFARGLTHGGYATDPMYADKLSRIIGGQTLRAALAG